MLNSSVFQGHGLRVLTPSSAQHDIVVVSMLPGVLLLRTALSQSMLCKMASSETGLYIDPSHKLSSVRQTASNHQVVSLTTTPRTSSLCSPGNPIRWYQQPFQTDASSSTSHLPRGQSRPYTAEKPSSRSCVNHTATLIALYLRRRKQDSQAHSLTSRRPKLR